MDGLGRIERMILYTQNGPERARFGRNEKKLAKSVEWKSEGSKLSVAGSSVGLIVEKEELKKLL